MRYENFKTQSKYVGGRHHSIKVSYEGDKTKRRQKLMFVIVVKVIGLKH